MKVDGGAFSFADLLDQSALKILVAIEPKLGNETRNCRRRGVGAVGKGLNCVKSGKGLVGHQRRTKAAFGWGQTLFNFSNPSANLHLSFPKL